MWVIFFAGKCCNYQKQKRKKKKIHRDKIKETEIAMFSSVKSGLVNKM